MEWVLFVVVVAAIAALAYLQHRHAAVRREALGRLARQLGWSFHARRDPSYEQRYGHELFRRGRDGEAFNTLRGTLDVGGRTFRVAMGDYTFKEGSGKDEAKRTLSYLVVEPPYVVVPSLVLRGEWFGDRVAATLGFDDIDFESEAFSRRFHVTSSKKDFAYAVIHPRMMEFLLARTPPRVELKNGDCLLWDGLSTWDVDDFRRWLGWARDFFALWPEHLVTRLEPGGQP